MDYCENSLDKGKLFILVLDKEFVKENVFRRHNNKNIRIENRVGTTGWHRTQNRVRPMGADIYAKKEKTVNSKNKCQL